MAATSAACQWRKQCQPAAVSGSGVMAALAKGAASAAESAANKYQQWRHQNQRNDGGVITSAARRGSANQAGNRPGVMWRQRKSAAANQCLAKAANGESQYLHRSLA